MVRGHAPRPGRSGRQRGVVAGALAVVMTLLALLVAGSAGAQSEAEDSEMLIIRGIDGTDPEHVEVTFLWTGSEEALGRMTLREDGEDRSIEVTTLRNAGGRTATVFLVDTSDSMGDSGGLAAVKESLTELVEEMPEGDQAAVVSYTNDVLVETAFTSDQNQLKRAIDGMVAPRDGRTALYDGLRRASLLLEERPDLQPNILVVGDGGDDASSADLAQARGAVVKSGSALFAVDAQHDGGMDLGPLRSIVDRTGGAIFPAATVDDIPDAFEAVDIAMQKQYVASYASGATQGDVAVTLTVGSAEQAGSFVKGAKAEGARVAPVEATAKAFGPSFLRGSSAGILAVVLVGLAIGLAAYAFINLSMTSDDGLSAVLRPYDEGGPAPEADEDQGLAQTALLQRAVEITETMAQRQGLLEKVAGLLERADLPLRAAEAIFFYLAALAVVVLAAFTLFGLVNGLMLVAIAALGPPAAISFMAGRRSKAFQRQLPDTLQMLSGSLRAGYSLLQGVEAVSQEVDEPMGKELRRVMTEARLGRDVEDALQGVADRMESPDFSWAVMAVRIQREVGGNLAELLDTVSETMVQRERLRRDVDALTAEGKISAIILGALPVGLGFIMYTMNPGYMEPLGSTTLGRIMLGLAIVAALAGFAWMKKIIAIDT